MLMDASVRVSLHAGDCRTPATSHQAFGLACSETVRRHAQGENNRLLRAPGCIFRVACRQLGRPVLEHRTHFFDIPIPVADRRNAAIVQPQINAKGRLPRRLFVAASSSIHQSACPPAEGFGLL